MGAQKLFVFKTHINYTNMGFVIGFVCQRLVGFFTNFWLFVSGYMVPLFGVISTYLFRLNMKNDFVEYNSSTICKGSKANDKIVSNYVKKQEKTCEDSVFDSDFLEKDGVREKETTEFSFRFKFPTYEDFVRTQKSNESVSSEAVHSTSTGKYEVRPEKSFTAFIEQQEPVSLNVEEVNAGPNNAFYFGIMNIDDGKNNLWTNRDFMTTLEKHEETKESVVNGGIGEEIYQKSEAVFFTKDKAEAFDEKENLQVSDEVESSSMGSNFSKDGFLSDKDLGGTFYVDHLFDIDDQMAESSDEVSDFSKSQASRDFEGEDNDIMKELSKMEEVCIDSTNSDSDESQESYDFEGEDSDIMKEVRELEDGMNVTNSDCDQSQESYDFEREEDSDIMKELRTMEDSMNTTDELASNFLSEKDFHEGSSNSNHGENDQSINNTTSSEFAESKNPSALETDDTNQLETLWEHQDLIEQLKMELKKVRATGLPTILEDSESPKIMDDLKPWKIDEKFQHENPMGELHRFYKSYREKTRKLDVLTYQKMYAIGFLQLKDPGQSGSSKKTSIPDIASLLSENLHQYKAKKHDTDPMKKFMNELLTDLELVYVGQMCLSWEVLHWQYGMALDLWDSDPRLIRRYNEVAGEFQQFQVLVQRFIEDEPFQGPRVQNYIKHRCTHRDFLQIPVIRDDIANDRKKGKAIDRGDYSITSDMLVEILEESIRLFWRFVRADKHCTNAKVKNLKTIPVDLQNPADSEMFLELQRDLQKKAKKLKEQLRSSNCILKKFRKHQEDESSSDPALFFFSQVDMKLVSRVLRMSKLTTEQLVWCRDKLSSISFVNRKIHVEPTFCLFPC